MFKLQSLIDLLKTRITLFRTLLDELQLVPEVSNILSLCVESRFRRTGRLKQLVTRATTAAFVRLMQGMQGVTLYSMRHPVSL
jgi:hypothetical protein